MKIFGASVVLVGTIAALTHSVAPNPAIVERLDLAYATDVAREKHRLDVFAPARARNAPVVIFVHGGDWREHDRKDYSYLGRSLAGEGFVVVVPSYRLWPTVNGAQMADDIAHVTAWTLQHAHEYGGRTNSVILSGHSSGAHLVALVALDPQYLRKYHLSPAVIHGVIAISGIDDLSYLSGAVAYGAFGRTRNDRWNLSPLRYVSRDAPPFEIVCAQSDIPLLCTQARIFFLKLRLAGASAEFFMGSGNHNSEIITAGFPADRLHLKIVQFVKAHA